MVHSWYAHNLEMCSMPVFLCFVLCMFYALTMIATWSLLFMYHVLTMIATWSLLFMYHVHVLCLDHDSYMVSPIQTQFWVCDWLGSNMAVRSVWVQSHSLLSLVMEYPFALSDHVLFGHPISYCSSLLVFYLCVVVHVYVVCCQMKYCIWSLVLVLVLG